MVQILRVVPAVAGRCGALAPFSGKTRLLAAPLVGISPRPISRRGVVGNVCPRLGCETRPIEPLDQQERYLDARYDASRGYEIAVADEADALHNLRASRRPQVVDK